MVCHSSIPWLLAQAPQKSGIIFASFHISSAWTHIATVTLVCLPLLLYIGFYLLTQTDVSQMEIRVKVSCNPWTVLSTEIYSIKSSAVTTAEAWVCSPELREQLLLEEARLCTAMHGLSHSLDHLSYWGEKIPLLLQRTWQHWCDCLHVLQESIKEKRCDLSWAFPLHVKGLPSP